MMQDFGLYVTLSLIVPILVLLGIIISKIVTGKKIPNNDYTPFDYIAGQTSVEFHAEKQEQEEDEDKGDDKDKNTKLEK